MASMIVFHHSVAAASFGPGNLDRVELTLRTIVTSSHMILTAQANARGRSIVKAMEAIGGMSTRHTSNASLVRHDEG